MLTSGYMFAVFRSDGCTRLLCQGLDVPEVDEQIVSGIVERTRRNRVLINAASGLMLGSIA